MPDTEEATSPNLVAPTRRESRELTHLGSRFTTGRLFLAAGKAVLSSCGDMTSFTFGPHTIRFRTSRHLRKYTRVKEWDRGYIVVDAVYDTLGEVEEYIDLVPVLEDLYFDADEFLSPIQEVCIEYA